jgi:hypothetical protein
VRSCREAEAFDGGDEEAAGGGVELAGAAHVAGGHFGVALDRDAAVAVALDLAGGFDPFTDRSAGFGGFDGGDFVGGQCGDFDLEVDPVEERAGDFGEVAGDLVLGADAFAPAVVVVAAGALLRCLFVI